MAGPQAKQSTILVAVAAFVGFESSWLLPDLTCSSRGRRKENKCIQVVLAADGYELCASSTPRGEARATTQAMVHDPFMAGPQSKDVSRNMKSRICYVFFFWKVRAASCIQWCRSYAHSTCPSG